MMDSRNFRRQPGGGYRLLLLLGVALFATDAGLGRIENRGTSRAAEPAAEKSAVAPPASDANASGQEENAALHVVDEQGNPISKFEISVCRTGVATYLWRAGGDGKIVQDKPLWGFDKDPALDLVVRADGYASTLQRFAGWDLEKLKQGHATVVLRPGKEVQVTFRLPPDMTWPDGAKPELYFDALKENIRLLAVPKHRAAHNPDQLPDFNMLKVHTEQPGKATVRLSAESAPFRVGIFSAGFLRFFERGPFTMADVQNGTLEIAVEKPASLAVQFDPSSAAGATPVIETAVISARWKVPGTSRLSLELGSSKGTEANQQLQLDDLPAGDYVLNVQTKARRDVKNISDNPAIRTNPGVFTASLNVSLKAGQSERIDFPYTPLDSDAFRGDRTATLHILKPDGSPVANRPVTVTYTDSHYGGLPAFSGTTSETGTATVSGITGRKADGVQTDPYSVMVGGERLGRFAFAADSTTEEFTFHTPPVVGDLAPNIELLNVTTGATAKLSDFRGKVVCLDFWATWCGPCQEPLGKMNQMVLDRREAWKDRAVVVPISIDDATDRVTDHVTKRGWTNLEYYWSGNNGVGGWESPAPCAFGIHGVPTSFIIDRDGKILWRGHPSDKSDGKDLEGRIEAAIEK